MKNISELLNEANRFDFPVMPTGQVQGFVKGKDDFAKNKINKDKAIGETLYYTPTVGDIHIYFYPKEKMMGIYQVTKIISKDMYRDMSHSKYEMKRFDFKQTGEFTGWLESDEMLGHAQLGDKAQSILDGIIRFWKQNKLM